MPSGGGEAGREETLGVGGGSGDVDVDVDADVDADGCPALGFGLSETTDDWRE
jgi:hypothetical protein